ncbi:ATP-binding cassette domain-containing protein [Marinobacter halodurans]|uniref:ATP-binding cassette domain-containing protein n=1 Tax=Marinobacter halodurans TaxID=2528979 RepID=A0ABY1ZN47_9GAMM|nr:ATP-binding cassette domain-containing protein [Marinobacter halodurans]TBW57914.1 ATP-binding cassette domain-containing protein [Marinobacter halodurans]
MKKPSAPTIPTDPVRPRGDHAESPVVQIDGLRKHFRSGGEDIAVFDNFGLTLASGQSLALVGRSGSGKSTLLNMLSGLEGWSAGSITLFGESLAAASARWSELRRCAIATVFQEANLMPALTLLENVRLRADIAGRDGADAKDWLDRLGIGSLAARYPDQVSGGQRQRAALAMVFGMQPRLLLADEPTGSLDGHTAADVADVLFEFQRAQGCPMILATHDPALAKRCDHTVSLGG